MVYAWLTSMAQTTPPTNYCISAMQAVLFVGLFVETAVSLREIT